MDPDQERITTEKARGGITHQHVRYVLIASLILAVIAMVIIFNRAPATDHTAPTQGTIQT